MKLIPYSRSVSLFNELESLLSHPLRTYTPLLRSGHPTLTKNPSPAVEWYEHADAYKARIDLPGFGKEHVSLTAEVGLVRVIVEKETTNDRPNKIESLLRCPEDVDTAAITATYQDGVLELTLPKEARKKPVTIEIQS